MKESIECQTVPQCQPCGCPKCVRRRKRVGFITFDLDPGQTGAWIVVAVHRGTGRKFVQVGLWADGSDAIGQAQENAQALNPFGTPDDWVFAVERYDFDQLVAQQWAEIDPDEPIPFELTDKQADELAHEAADRTEVDSPYMAV